MIEVADIFRRQGLCYRQTRWMPPSHRRVMGDIVHCRTGLFGGELWRCDACSKDRYVYHSCGNRHCPKCGGKPTQKWLQAQGQLKLPCPYFFFTFTLPHTLNPLVQVAPKKLYHALQKQSYEALKVLAHDPKFLGADPGCISVLHTWDQKLGRHLHVHCLIPAGGMQPDGTWVPAPHKNFLVPIAALRKVFKAKMKAALAQHHLLDQVDPKTWTQKWVVHVQPAGTGDRVLGYLARYLFRVAISNSRIERYENEEVTFRYRNRKRKRTERCHLSGEAFIQRFLLHVLPFGFHKIRYYGIFSPSWRKRLGHLRRDLLQDQAETRSQTERESESSGPEEPTCPNCRHGHLIFVAEIKRSKRGPPWY